MARRKRGCCIKSCEASVYRGHYFCLPHWVHLSAEQRTNILTAYKLGDKAKVRALASEIADRIAALYAPSSGTGGV